ncbi:MAG: fibrobacter succinogenes major paralogous domain-containing protein [Bacteroidia bacterium]
MKPLLVIFILALFSFQSKTDNEIASVKIGNQLWTARNLDVSTFRNGDRIPEIENQKKFLEAGRDGKPAWCNYNGSSLSRSKYGKLYNWYAIHDKRGLAPQGWHIPTDDEWTTLTGYLGGNKIAGKKMKSNNGWDGDNSSSFNALPAGCSFMGAFTGLGSNARFWSATDCGEGYARIRYLNAGTEQVNQLNGCESDGFSVRCIHD